MNYKHGIVIIQIGVNDEHIADKIADELYHRFDIEVEPVYVGGRHYWEVRTPGPHLIETYLDTVVKDLDDMGDALSRAYPEYIEYGTIQFYDMDQPDFKYTFGEW